MSMAETFTVLARLVEDKVIDAYAIAGAVAAYNYIEAAVTDDLDVLIAVEKTGDSGLLTLAPIFAALRSMGYTEFRAEGIVIGEWPVQFLPVASELDGEALRTAETIDIELRGQSFKARILRPEYLVAKALEVGRSKDYTRVVQFVEDEAVDMGRLQDVLRRFGLGPAWETFCWRTGIQRHDHGNG